MTQITQITPEPENEPQRKPLGTVRVDERGRVYLRSLSRQIRPGTLYMLDAEEAPSAKGDDADGLGQPPRTIRMRLVEPAIDPAEPQSPQSTQNPSA